MALHTELPIYRTGVRLLDLAVKAQVQMPRTENFLACPSRIGQRLHHRDGRVTDLQGNTIETQGANHVSE